jgi:transcriptional regulator with XRE-family HTH domain
VDNLDKQIGEKLKHLRENKGYSMREVADRIDIAPSYISQIEKGRIPSLDKLKKLCNVYDVPVSYLFGDGEFELPNEIKEKGVKWISFIDKMEKKELEPEDIERLLDILKLLNKL